MSVRSDTVAALARVLDKNERQALLWACQIGADIADSVAMVDPPLPSARENGRLLRALLPTMRDAAESDGPHDCTSCGVSMANCDKKLTTRRRACCGDCSLNDTHGDTPSGYAERMRAQLLEGGTHG